MSPGKERNLECPQKQRWVTVAAEGSEVRLPGRLEARANRLMQAMPWIFTLSSKQRESIDMFQPWNGRVRFVFQKDLLGCQGRMDL